MYNYALGNENKIVAMKIPKSRGVFRTGLASVSENNRIEKDNYVFTVEMKKGSELLISLPKLNYLKCDIEGYEEFVLPEIKEIIKKHKPIIQVETSGKQKTVIFNLMNDLGYVSYYIQNNHLVKYLPESPNDGDYIFIYKKLEDKIVEKVKRKKHA